jgi:hypothetical protein
LPPWSHTTKTNDEDSLEETSMNQPVTFDAVLATGKPERKAEVRLLALWPFLLVVAILATVALISESQFTPDQRIEAFGQSGVYP